MDGSFFDYTFLDEPLVNYFWCIGIIVGTLLLRKYLAKLVARISDRMVGKLEPGQQAHSLQNLMLRPVERLLQVILYYIALYQVSGAMDVLSLHINTGKSKHAKINIDQVADHIFLLLFIIFLAQVFSRVIDYIYYQKVHRANEEDNLSQQQLLPLVRDMSKLLLWTLSIFWILGSVFAVNIPALITGLGIGGVAIALAGKETVENFFAAFTILTDKPFQTGEIIKLGAFEGKVERIGFRSTRLRSTEGEVYIIPNKNMVGENLTNLTQRTTQGVKLLVNIKHGVPYDKLQQMVAELKQVVKATKLVQDPTDVTLETYGEKVFQVQVAYHLPNPMPDGIKDVDIKQQVNLKVYEIVTKYTTDGGVAIHVEEE